MKIKRVFAVYYSATGTTKKVIQSMGHQIANTLAVPYEEHCFNLPQAREVNLSFASDDLVLFGVPVYAGRVPNLMLPYLQTKIQGQQTPAVALVLYGNRNYDDGLIELRNVMTEHGFCTIGAGAFVGEHSFSRILGAGRPDQQDMALVGQLADQCIHVIQTMDAPPQTPVSVTGCDPIRPYYTPRDRHGEPIHDFLKAKPKTNLEQCSQCGLCAQLCPMGSIDPADVTQVVGKCIKCCACVKNCPTNAKYFDHEGYLYHQHELEEQYAARRAPSEIFFLS